MSYSFVLLIVRCPCGGIVQDNFTVIAMTSHGMFCFAGPCPECGRVVGASKSLTQMQQDCKTIPVEGQELSDYDQELLKGMQIAFGEAT